MAKPIPPGPGIIAIPNLPGSQLFKMATVAFAFRIVRISSFHKVCPLSCALNICS
jgi:hypothetical protein